MDKKKWVVVTGASSGLGECTVGKLVEEGFSVVATARNEERLNFLYGMLPNIEIIPWDLSEISKIKEYAKSVKAKTDSIYGLVHCAGSQVTLPVHMIKESKIKEIFDINTFSAMLLVSAFSKKGMAFEGTSFVLISSLAAHEGAFGKSIYAASKGALEGFIKSVAPELAEKNMRINAIAPGVVKTEMVERYFSQLTEEQRLATVNEYPLGLGHPEDIADMVIYLLGEKSKWITGQTIVIDGGHLVRKC